MKDDDSEEIFEGKWYLHGPMRNALLSGLLTGVAFGLAHWEALPRAVEIALYVIAIPLGGYHWMREGIEELIKEKEVQIDILMMAAAVGAALLGMWDEAAFLVFLYGAAEGLEEYTYAKTRASIRHLLDLVPQEAKVIRDGREETVPARELRIGDVFLVRPGESIPTDGVVVKGRSSVNEAPVTGESIPVEKIEWAKVFAATMNQEGALEVRVTATFEDNTLTKMVHLVEEAQEQKSKNQLFIEKFGRIYSPIVLVAALLLVCIPPFLGAPFLEWARRAIVLLVAAAPCALVMSTPVAIAAGIGRAGKFGVLIKGGIHLESLGKVAAVAFDKTGTLTKGEPTVTDVVAFEGGKADLLALAYNLERNSEHPLAVSIVQEAKKAAPRTVEVAGFQSLVGAGVKAVVEGQTFYVGKAALFQGLGVGGGFAEAAERLEEEGKTVVCVGSSDKVRGLIALQDRPSPHAKDVVASLHAMGIKTIVLTGDNEKTARAVGRETGISDVKAGLKPEDKIRAIKELSLIHI